MEIISIGKIKDYNNIFDNKYNFVPIVFTNGTILLYDQNKYIIAINNVDLDNEPKKLFFKSYSLEIKTRTVFILGFVI